jgi:hypothetical protein
LKALIEDLIYGRLHQHLTELVRVNDSLFIYIKVLLGLYGT